LIGGLGMIDAYTKNEETIKSNIKIQESQKQQNAKAEQQSLSTKIYDTPYTSAKDTRFFVFIAGIYCILGFVNSILVNCIILLQRLRTIKPEIRPFDTISIRSTDNGTPKRRRQSYSSERSNSNKSDVKVTMLGGKEKKISDTYKNSPSLQSILSMSTGTLKKSASKVLVESIKDLHGQRRLSGEIDNR